MSTEIRPELSSKNPYWIEKHRYYELKHFCLQYPIWKKAYAALGTVGADTQKLQLFSKTNQHKSPTERCAEARLYYQERMKLVEQTAVDAGAELAGFLLKGITEGISYDIMSMQTNVPCCKDVYYDRYRKFFWLLNKGRG